MMDYKELYEFYKEEHQNMSEHIDSINSQLFKVYRRMELLERHKEISSEAHDELLEMIRQLEL